MKTGRQVIHCPVCRIDVNIPLANNYSLISLLKCWHANILGPDFIVPQDRKHKLAVSAHQSFEIKVQKVSAAAAPPLPPPPPQSLTHHAPSPQSTRPQRVSKSELNTDLAVAFAGHLAPDIDGELLKVLIRQNFFKDDGIYAAMLPDTESDSEEEDDDEDDDDEPPHRVFRAGFARVVPGPGAHSSGGSNFHGRSHFDHHQPGGRQSHPRGRNQVSPEQFGHSNRGRHHGGHHHHNHGDHHRGRWRGGRRGGRGRGRGRSQGAGGDYL
jgi:hypothetical protein